jgi:cell division protein FtsI/penicillin-binding protein 2
MPTRVERQRRIRTRALPLAAAAVISFILGAMTGSTSPPEKAAAGRFADAWASQDFAAMHAELNPASAAKYSTADLAKAYLQASETATERSVDPGSASDPSSEGGRKVVTVPMTVNTIAFGSIEKDLKLPFADGGVDWDPSLVFPGLRPGEQLANAIRLAIRAPIYARDGSTLAKGPAIAREYPLGTDAIDVTGEVGTADPADETELARQGFPPGTPVGISGVEKAFNARLAGRPGGELLAQPSGGGDSRILAQSDPKPGKPVKTTIDPTLQEASVAALAGRSGGIAVLDAQNGQIRALAGQAFSAPQPPGSTFKMVTTTAALAKKVVSLDDTFPITNGVSVGGRFIYNANGEYCGGSFVEAFAVSCNAVFAPLGPKIGNDDLVKTAEGFGWNTRPKLYNRAALDAINPPAPSIPKQIGDDLDLGVSAIGQGEVLSTPLEMATVAQTIGNNGVRMPTPLVTDRRLGPHAKPVRVMSPKLAHTLRDLMIGVVTSGTGTAGAIPEAQVAGKTGTAELGPEPGQENSSNPIQIKDAWFAAFVPAEKPKLAAGMVLIDAGASGGEVAAPAIAQIFSAGL